jgi:hypothetical protein
MKGDKRTLEMIKIIVLLLVISFLWMNCATYERGDGINLSPDHKPGVKLIIQKADGQQESTGFGSYNTEDVRTNQDGQYSLCYSTKETDNFFRGFYLVARKNGYEEKSIKVQRKSDIQIINFQLEPL